MAARPTTNPALGKTSSTEPDTPGRLASLCAVLFPLLVVGAVLFRLTNVAIDHLACPSDLVYEAPNLATIRQIGLGHAIYDKRVYDGDSFVLTMYTPLYHYLVALLPERAGHPFFSGRVVSMVGMLGAAGLLLLPGRGSRSWILPLVAVGAFFCVRPIVSNTVYLRHDPLGLLFSGAAVVLVARGSPRMWHVMVAGLLAAAAFLTKQSFLASGVCCCLFLLLNNRRQAAVFALCWIAPVLIAAAAFYTWCGHEGVWFSWFTAPRNPLDSGIFVGNWQQMFQQPVFALLALMVATTLVLELRRERWRMLKDSPYAIYWALATVSSLLMSAKIGASTNVFFEFVLAGLLWLMYAFRNVSQTVLARPRALLLLLVLCYGQAMELAMAQPTQYSFIDRQPREMAGQARAYSPQELKEGRIAFVREELAELGQERTRLLNLTQEVWITASLTDDCCLNDPLAYVLLWEQGAMSNEKFVSAIQRQEFAVILLPRADQPPEAEFWTHRLPAWQEVVRAVEENYYTQRQGIYRYMTPRLRPK